MIPDDKKPRSLILKLGGLVLIILGFLLMAIGYRYGMGWYLTMGIVALIVGAFFLVRKIALRNQPYPD